MEKKRVAYCDLIRALAIGGVILLHVFADHRDMYLASNKTYYFILTFLDSLTRYGVGFFFMLTGCFMLNKKEESYGKYLKKKIPKLFFPFLIASIIYYFYEANKAGNQPTFLEFVNLFSTGNIKYHFWYMYSIITIYLLIPFIRIIVNSSSRKTIKEYIILIFASTMLIAINNFIHQYKVNVLTEFILPSIFVYIGYLLLGYYLYNYDISKKTRKLIYVLAIISIILMPTLDYMTTKSYREDVFLIATSPFAFIHATALFIYIKQNYQKKRHSKLIEKTNQVVAANSFYMYLIHVMVMEITKKQMLKYFVPDRFLLYIAFIIVEFILTFVISCLISICIRFVIKIIGQGLRKVPITSKKV